MFTTFERLLKPTDTPERSEPPPHFVAFFWHYARQAKGLFAALFAAGLVVALLDSTIPVFMGRIVTLITASPPQELFAKFWPHLLGMGAVYCRVSPWQAQQCAASSRCTSHGNAVLAESACESAVTCGGSPQPQASSASHTPSATAHHTVRRARRISRRNRGYFAHSRC